MAEPGQAPPFVNAILASDNPKAVLERLHPDYDTHSADWRTLIDAFEGTGGFLDGSYLWEYPREDSDAYERRCTMARYHNYLESLVDLYVRFIWTQGVSRASTNEEYNAWTERVDGKTKTLDALLKELASFALVTGHAGVLVDKTADEPMGDAKADERAEVVASAFSSLSIPDWRFDRSDLIGIKLLESAPPVDLIDEEPTGTDAVQYLLWTHDGWARFNAKGELVAASITDLGLVPFVLLRPKPSYLSPMLGRALCGNANLVKALFNRASEEDEVIRAQAFSVLTVSVPADGDLAEVKESLGNTIGVAKALVVKGDIDFKTPDQTVPAAIRANMAYLVEELYRMAHVRFSGGGLQKESGESIRLQYTELNEMLQGFAKALTQAEQDIARAWFAWTFATPEQAQAAYEAAKVEVRYPSEFFLDDLMTDLEAWAEAMRMNLGETMAKRLKKRAVRRLEPDIPAEDLETVYAEIDALKDEPVTMLAPLDRGDPEGEAMARMEGEAVN